MNKLRLLSVIALTGLSLLATAPAGAGDGVDASSIDILSVRP